MSKLAAAPAWQQQRAMQMQIICQELEALIPQAGKLNAIKMIAARFSGAQCGGKVLKLSPATLRREFDRWSHNGKTVDLLLYRYKPGSARKAPDDLLHEFAARLTKTGGKKYGTRVYRDLVAEWKSGAAIPGLGTWREWYAREYPRRDLPQVVPDFPIGYWALQRYSPTKTIRALAERGVAAASQMLSIMERDSSTLRPFEVYVCDDKVADHQVYDVANRCLVRPTLYFMMEVGSRYICAVVTRGTERILATDVDALVGYTLNTCGVGGGYVTHLIFERGTTACSPAKQAMLEALFPGALKIHRTGMYGGKIMTGWFHDKATGKARSKGMIEAFMRKLDIRLSNRTPGHTGNRYENQPAQLDAQMDEANTLGAVNALTGAKLDLPVPTLAQYNEIIRAAIQDYNTDPHHDCQGFHQRTQIEIQPGEWRDLPENFTPTDIEEVRHAI